MVAQMCKVRLEIASNLSEVPYRQAGAAKNQWPSAARCQWPPGAQVLCSCAEAAAELARLPWRCAGSIVCTHPVPCPLRAASGGPRPPSPLPDARHTHHSYTSTTLQFFFQKTGMQKEHVHSQMHVNEGVSSALRGECHGRRLAWFHHQL